MQRELPRQRGGSAPLTFDSKLEKEEEILEALLSALAKGQLPPETWTKLHLAAVRDDRLSNLALAYESVALGKRLKTQLPATVAEFLYRASTFFSDAFGDELGAVSYLERAILALPAHAGAFEKLDQLHTKSENWKTLAELCASVAPHRPKPESVPLLRRAAELFEREGSSDEKVIEIHQQVLRLDPQDEKTRDALEARYLKANRHRDVTRILEQALTIDPPPSEEYALRLRARLIELFAGHLHEPERSMPHVEALLAKDPSNEEARRVAHKLLEMKGLAARAAAALAAAYEDTGVPADVAKFLAIELEHTRGPKRKDVLRKIGILRQDRLNDEAGAYESFEAALALDPADDDLRARYVALANKLGKALDAARTLGRVGTAAKDPALRARLTAEVGELYLAGGDAKRARATFVSVLAIPELDAAASLVVSRALVAIYAAEQDNKSLADVLEKVATLETDPERRQIANEELAELAQNVLNDVPRATAAWKRLLETPARARALAALEPLYEAAGDDAELALLLEERSKDVTDPAEARRLAFRAAEVLTTKTTDVTRASDAWKRLVEKYGAARDALAQWIPLLEAQKKWGELAAALDADAQLAPESERAAVFARLGGVRLTKTREIPAAIDAFRRALSVDASEKASRAALEKLVQAGDQRLAAADVLEPFVRADGSPSGLLKVLDVKASLGADPGERLAAMGEAVQVAERSESASDRGRALEFAGRGLAESVASQLVLAPWLERIDRLAPPTSDPKKRAAVLGHALGETVIASPELLDLAKRAGEAHASSGDVATALALYRRALAFEPSSTELLSRVDDLLKDQGSPGERILLYRAALDRNPDAARRRELLHKIGGIERSDVGDRDAAIATYRGALADSEDDREAYVALVELYGETENWDLLTELLERHLELATERGGDREDARRARVQLAGVAAAHGQTERALSHAKALLLDKGLTADDLGAVLSVAETVGDVDVAREALERRVESVDDPREQSAWLEKLGALELSRKDAEAATHAWKRAALLAEKAGEDEQARNLYDKIRNVAPRDRAAAARHAALLERAGMWERLPPLYAILLDHAETPAERVDLLMRHARVLAEHLDDAASALVSAAQAFELAPDYRDVLPTFTHLALLGKATPIFARAMDDAIARLAGKGPELAAQRADLAMAKARVLASNREGRDVAVLAYRSVLEDEAVDEARRKAAMLAFESLLASEGSLARKTDRRWLLAWRAEHAAEGGVVPALLAWASAEETTFDDRARALELYRKVLALDPENADVMAAVSRLALATGDTGGAIIALALRRDRSEGAARNALDLEIATILLERTDRPDEALGSVAAVLQSAPQDDAALALASRLLQLPATHAPAVAMLERASESAEDVELRARILRELLAAHADPPDPRELRTRWFERLHDLHHAQGRLDLAFTTALEAAEELPIVGSLWERAETLARELSLPNDVAELYHRALAKPLPKESAIELGQRAVAFHEEWFEDSAGVVRILERILEIDSGASWAFDRLKLLFDAQERWEDLFGLFDRALAVATDARRLELLEDAAQIAKDFANDSDRAVAYLEQLLPLKPGDARLVASLERLYERQGSHRELIALLMGQIGAMRPADAQRSRARIALLWLDEIGDAASSLAVVEDMMANDEGNGLANVGERGGLDLFALLERVLAAAPPHVESRESGLPPPSEIALGEERRRRDSVPVKSRRPSVRQRSAALLKELYTQSGREADLVRILEVELETIKAVRERIRRHRQIAALHRKLGNDVAATEHYASLVMLEPDVAAHRAELSELAAKVGRYDRLAEVLAAAAEDCTDSALRVELTMHAGDVHMTNLGDAGRAIELYLRILSMPKVDPVSALAAAKRAEPLLDAAGRSWERLDVLERTAPLESDADARRATHTTAARLATELGENARAIAAWEARLGEGDDADALDGLAALLEREKRWERLIEVLERRASSERAEAERRADRVRVARIWSDELASVKNAILAWETVEEEFGESDESMDALAVLLKLASRWKDLADLLERGSARAQTPERRAALLAQLGQLQQDELDEPDHAIASYEGALSTDPHNAVARAGLSALLEADLGKRKAKERGALRAAAVDVLLRSYATTDEWRLSLALTEHRLDTAKDARARVRVLREAAQLAEERGKDQAAAFHFVRRAFIETPDDSAVEVELQRLAEAGVDLWRAFADAHAEVLARFEARGAEADAPTFTRLRFRFGEVLETRLDDAAGALAAYLRAGSEAPSDLAIARAAIRVGGRTARWDAAAGVVIEFMRALGRASDEIFLAVEEAAQGASAWDASTSAIATLLGTTAELPPAVARDLEARLGTWHRDRRGDPEAAEQAFARALAHDGANAELLASLAQIQRRAKGRPLIDSLLRLSQATGGDLDLLREAAEIATTTVADRALAKSILDSLLKLAKDRWLGGASEPAPSVGTPTRPAPLVQWSLAELVRIHAEEGNLDRNVDLLVETSRLPFDKSVSRAMMHEAAEIARDKLADPSRAIALYASLFQDDPNDEKAVQALASLYEREGRHADLLGFWRTLVTQASMAPRRVALRLPSARLQVKLGDVDAGIATLRENLGDDARHAETVAELVSVFEANARHAELTGLLAEQAALAEAAGEAVAAGDLWTRAATVAESTLGNADLAIAHHQRVVAIEPRIGSLDALARLSSAKGDHAAAAGHLEQLRARSPASSRSTLTLRLADELAAAGQSEVARARLEEASLADLESEPLRARLARMYRETEAWEPLAELLSRGAAHAPDKATRLSRLLEAATLFAERCKKPDRAIPLLEQAADLEPEDRSIRLELADALGVAGRHAEARTMLKALIDSFGGRRPKERAPAHYHLARLELVMGDRARALVELDAATRIDPANPQILRALAELARDDGQLERAERSYRALLVALKRPEEADDLAPIVRSEVLLELSAIAERQGQKDRSMEILESALEMGTKSDVEGRRLERALRDRGDFPTLIRALEGRLARAAVAPSTAAQILSDLAEVLDVQLGHLADAFTARLRAVGLIPSLAAAHDAALALARRTDGTARYVAEVEGLVERAEKAGDAPLAFELLARLAVVAENDLKDDARAAALYERARKLELPGKQLAVLRALDRVYERLGDDDAQARVLGMRVTTESKVTDPEAAADALYRYAALRLASPATADEGCNLLSDALDAKPEIDRAQDILKTAANAHPKNERVLALYERIGRMPGHERALVDALTRRAELASDPAPPLREAVSVAKSVGEGGLAESLLRRFIERAREHGELGAASWALVSLADLRAAAGDVNEAIALKTQAADAADPETARRLRFDVAKLAAEALGNLSLAAKTYEGLLEHEPADREAWAPLLEVYRRTENAAALVALIARVVEFVDDNAERSRLRLERVKVMMKDLGLGDDAAKPLREIVEDDATQVEAAILLAGILERTGRQEELTELLAKQLDAAKDRSDAPAVASISLRLAVLLEKKSHAEAKTVLYAGLEWEPKGRELLEALVRIHANDGETDERADVLERLLAATGGAETEKLALELFALRTELSDTEGAERALEVGFRANPESVGLRERLEKVCRDRGAWAKLAEVFVLDADARSEPAERVARLREAAALHRGQLADAKKAAEILRGARRVAPNDRPLLEDLVQTLVDAGDHGAAATELTSALAAVAEDDASRAPLLGRRAAVLIELRDDDGALEDLESAYSLGGAAFVAGLGEHLGRLRVRAAERRDHTAERVLRLRLAEILPVAGDVDAARALVTELVKQDPKDRDALRALARIEEGAQRWDQVTATYRRLVPLEEGDAAVSVALRLADACERAGRFGDARGALERARMVAPHDDALLQRLMRLYEETGAFRELAEMSLSEANAAKDVAGRFAHLLRAGSLFMRQGDDGPTTAEGEVDHVARAIAALDEAHKLRPVDMECTVLLADAFTLAGRTAEAIDLINAAIATHKGRRSRELAALYHRLARVAHMTGDSANEIAWLSSALDMDGQNGFVASELATVAMEMGQLEIATRALRAITMLKNAASSPLAKALAYQHLGEIAQQQGDVKRAVLLLKRAIDDDPTLTTARALLDQLQAQ